RDDHEPRLGGDGRVVLRHDGGDGHEERDRRNGSDCVGHHLDHPIDPAAEIARLDREIEKAEGELQRLVGKLNNKSFVERAPAEVVAREREKLANQTSALERLREQRKKLAGLAP
ncbi:MAG: hypothetical protein AAGL66_19380, partial [Pseudomonadota bacterium]